MRIVKYLHNLYWNRFLGGLYRYVEPYLKEEWEFEWLEPAFKGLITVLILLACNEIRVRIGQGINNYRIRKSMLGYDVREPYTVKDSSFVEELDAAQYPVHTLQQMKQEKRYGRLGEVHAKLNQPNEAAYWFQKDKQYERAAEELAKAGKTVQAARLLMRTGNYETAARFFRSDNRYKQAATAWLKAERPVEAASVLAEGDYMKRAATMFQQIFQAGDTPTETQQTAADRCYHLLEKGAFADVIATEQRNALFKAVAQRFLASGRHALAARAFQEAGETRLAGEVYKHIQKIQINGVSPVKRRDDN